MRWLRGRPRPPRGAPRGRRTTRCSGRLQSSRERRVGSGGWCCVGTRWAVRWQRWVRVVIASVRSTIACWCTYTHVVVNVWVSASSSTCACMMTSTRACASPPNSGTAASMCLPCCGRAVHHLWQPTLWQLPLCELLFVPRGLRCTGRGSRGPCDRDASGGRARLCPTVRDGAHSQMPCMLVYVFIMRCGRQHASNDASRPLCRHAYTHVPLLVHLESLDAATVGPLAPGATPPRPSSLSPQHHFLRYYHHLGTGLMAPAGRAVWGATSCQPRMKTSVEEDGRAGCVYRQQPL